MVRWKWGDGQGRKKEGRVRRLSDDVRAFS